MFAKISFRFGGIPLKFHSEWYYKCSYKSRPRKTDKVRFWFTL
jgi:hypothetical protein